MKGILTVGMECQACWRVTLRNGTPGMPHRTVMLGMSRMLGIFGNFLRIVETVLLYYAYTRQRVWNSLPPASAFKKNLNRFLDCHFVRDEVCIDFVDS